MADQKAPAALGKAGRALWRDVVRDHLLRPDDYRVLEQAGRTLDYIERLDQALTDAPLTVAGSAGQLREHPLLSEVRQQRALLARLLGQLALPDLELSEDEVAAMRRARSQIGRKAARARWSA